MILSLGSGSGLDVWTNYLGIPLLHKTLTYVHIKEPRLNYKLAISVTVKGLVMFSWY